jgi:putative transposase
LLKLGVDVSQVTVGRYLPRRPKTPSPTWRSFLHNHLTDTVAIDMFIVATATFRIPYILIVLDHDWRKIIHFGVIENPAQVWLSHQIAEAFPWDTAPRYLLRDREASYGPVFRSRGHRARIWQMIRSSSSTDPADPSMFERLNLAASRCRPQST